MPVPFIRDDDASRSHVTVRRLLRLCASFVSALFIACAGSTTSDPTAASSAGSSGASDVTSAAATTEADSETAADPVVSGSGSGDACEALSSWPGDLSLGAVLGSVELSCVRSIDGSLIVENVGGLVDLAMLANLESVGVDVFITENPDLVSLNGLEGLSDIGGRSSEPAAGVIHFSGNPRLADIRGIAGLHTLLGMDFAGLHPALVDIGSLAGDLSIRPSDAGGLIAISGLPNVLDLDGLLAIGTVDVGGAAPLRVGIGGMDGLLDVSGLSAFSHLGDDLSLLVGALPLPVFEFFGDGRLGALHIAYYPVLSSLQLPGVESIGVFELSDGLPALTDLVGSDELVHIDQLWIGACGGALDFGLETLAGLESVESIDELVIVGTPSLVSIDALTPGTVIGSVLIQDNASLQADAALAHLELLDVRGPATVCNNLGDAPCTRVPAACQPGPAPG